MVRTKEGELKPQFSTICCLQALIVHYIYFGILDFSPLLLTWNEEWNPGIQAKCHWSIADGCNCHIHIIS